MAFLRFNRDKRGYEHFYLVEPTTNRRGKVRARVLYWFRSPPNVKVGRQPFDPDVRRALEAQNPRATFDWRKIVETPIPSADAEHWRERRRAERAARIAVPETQEDNRDESDTRELPPPKSVPEGEPRYGELDLDRDREDELEQEAVLDSEATGGDSEAMEGEEIAAAAVDAAERQEDKLVPEGSLNPIDPREPLVEIAVAKPIGSEPATGAAGERRRRRRRRRRGGARPPTLEGRPDLDVRPAVESRPVVEGESKKD